MTDIQKVPPQNVKFDKLQPEHGPLIAQHLTELRDKINEMLAKLNTL